MRHNGLRVATAVAWIVLLVSPVSGASVVFNTLDGLLDAMHERLDAGETFTVTLEPPTQTQSTTLPITAEILQPLVAELGAELSAAALWEIMANPHVQCDCISVIGDSACHLFSRQRYDGTALTCRSF